MYKVFQNGIEIFDDNELDICVSYAHSIYNYGDMIKIMNKKNKVAYIIGLESKMNEPITIEDYINTIHEWTKQKSNSIKDRHKR